MILEFYIQAFLHIKH